MDEHRFDTLTRGLASSVSRRGGLRLLAAAGASLLALARGKGEAAAQAEFLAAGEPCYSSDQCRGADAPLVCDDNGFDYDGPRNCCTFEGSRCGADEHCCGLNVCFNGSCRALAGGSNIGSIFAAPGDPCQSTDQCNRPQTGAICQYTASTGDARCCWYEGSLCSSGAQCCGSRVCAGGVCQFLDGDSNQGDSGGSSMVGPGDPCQSTDQCNRPQTGAICQYTVSTGDSRCCWYEGSFCTSGAQCCGSRVCAGGVCRFPGDDSGGGSGIACTWEGCPCVLYRDPDCRASCPLNDPCDPGLVCTGTSEDIGTCVQI